MPMPSPTNMPFESSSNGRMSSLVVNAGVFEKDMYINGELSQQTPPEIITSERYSSKSETAILIAANEPAHAASTTQLVPPKSKRLAIRPAITLPSMPGNEFSSQPMYAFLNFSIIIARSASSMPDAFNTFSSTGPCRREVSGDICF